MSKKSSLGKQERTVRNRLAAHAGLLFIDFFEEPVAAIIKEIGLATRERIYTPLVTIAAFVCQALARGSCRKAVARVCAERLAAGKKPPSPNDDAYCEARGRLPLTLYTRVLYWLAERLEKRVSPHGPWLGRRVFVVDGSSFQTQDTPENRACFGLPSGVKPGCGFPVVGFVAVFSLFTGAIHRLAFRSPKEGERRAYRRHWDLFKPGDVQLTDRGFNSYGDLALASARGLDSVMRVLSRRLDFRKGKRLGPGDHLVTWLKPTRRPQGLTQAEYDSLPEEMLVREIRYSLAAKGYRTKVVDLVTTLLDPVRFPREALADLYRRRWEAEINFRHIKSTMGTDMLSTKSPDMVYKEIATRMIAYNLLRELMWEAGARHGVDPLRISMKGTIDRLDELARILAEKNRALRRAHVDVILEQIARDIVPDRPGRSEPRAQKRRPKNYPFMKRPRNAPGARAVE